MTNRVDLDSFAVKDVFMENKKLTEELLECCCSGKMDLKREWIMNKLLVFVLFFSFLLCPIASEAVDVYGERALYSMDKEVATKLLDELQILHEQIDNALYEERNPDKIIQFSILKRVCSTNDERLTSLYYFIKLNDSIIKMENIPTEVLDEMDKYLTSNAILIDKALNKEVVFINGVVNPKEKDLILEYKNDLRILLNDFSELIRKTVKF